MEKRPLGREVRQVRTRSGNQSQQDQSGGIIVIVRIASIVAVLFLAACATVTEPDRVRRGTAPVNVQVNLVTDDKTGNACSDQRLTQVAESVAAGAFQRLPGQYEVEIARLSGQRMACFGYPFGVNALRWVTVVGVLWPGIYDVEASYTVTVRSDGQEVLKRDVERHERSTKYPINFGRHSELAEEAVWVFQRSLSDTLTEAVQVARRQAATVAPKPVPVQVASTSPPVVSSAGAPVSPAQLVPGTATARGGALFRGGPTPTAVVLQTLPVDTPVQLRSQMSNVSGRWWYVELGGKTGWIQVDQLAQ